MKVDNTKPQMKSVFVFPVGHGVDRAGFRPTMNDVYILPKELDENVVKLHIPHWSSIVLTQERAVSKGVKVESPFKSGHCGY